MALGPVLVIVLVLLLVGALPWWPHSSDWGWLPLRVVAVMLLVVLLLRWAIRF